MKTRLKQITALSMAAALVLSACGNEKPASSSNPSPSPGSSSAPAKEKLTLSFMIMLSNPNAQLPSNKDTDMIRKAIEQKFNVELKLDYAPNLNDFTTKLNLRLSSGDVPDLFQGGGPESSKYITDKVTADMTPYVTEANMPNYFKYWITKEELQRYQIQNVFMRSPIIFNKEQFASHYVRKDWIDALNKKDPSLNLKVPTNYDEFLAVAKAFTNNDPDANGKNDTYGITAAAGGNAIPKDIPAWHKHNLSPGFLIENGQFIDTASDIKAGEVFKDVKELIALKVIDPDFYLQKGGQQLEKVQQGRVGMFYGTARDAIFENSPNSVQKKTKDTTGKPAEFVPFNIAPNNAIGYQALPGTPFMFSAKTSADKIKRTMEILDWLAGEEGYLLTHYGQEGVHYKRDGKKIVVDPAAYKKDFTDNGSYNEVYTNIFGNINISPAPLGLELVNPSETDRDRKMADQVKAYKYALLGTNLAPIPGLDLAAFRKQLYTYHAQVVFDDKDTSNWPKYRAELMGKYNGKGLFEGYASQVGAALKQDIKFKSDN